jgi:RecG-like helicase
MTPNDLLTTHFRLDEPHKKALKRLNIATVYELLLHLPQRYEDISSIQSVSSLQKGQDAVVYGQIGGLKTRKAWTSKVPRRNRPYKNHVVSPAVHRQNA